MAGEKAVENVAVFLRMDLLCGKKDTIMLRNGKMSEERARVYDEICGEMRGPLLNCTPSLAASLICVMTGVDRKTADNLFFEELGLSLEDAIEALKRPIRHF